MTKSKNSEPNLISTTGCQSSKLDDLSERELLFQRLTEGFHGNDEERLQWQAYCQAALARADKKTLQEAVVSLANIRGEHSSAKRALRNWPFLLIPLAFALLALVNKFHLQNYQLDYSSLKGEHGFAHSTYGGEIPSKQAQKRLTEEELLLVFGTVGSSQDESPPLPLHQRYPHDLGYLSDYLATKKTATEEDFERAMTLDPDNGFFPLFYAGHLTEQSLKYNPQYSSSKKDLPFRIITDPQKFEKALALVKLASKKTKFVKPSNDLQRKRMSLLPSPRTIAEEADYLAALHHNSSEDFFSLLELGNAIVTKTETFISQNDKKALEDFANTAFKFVPRSLAATENSLGPFAHHHYLRKVTKPLATRAREQDLPQLATDLEALQSEIEHLHLWKRSKTTPGATASKNGWPLLEFSIGYYEGAENVIQPTIADYEPGRMKWLLNVERSILYILAGFFISIAILLFLLSFLRRKATRNILPRFGNLLPIRQRLFILLTSFFVPLVSYLTITRLTPLGCLDWNINYLGGQPHAYNILSGATLFVVISIALTSTLVRRRLSRLGLTHPAGWLVWAPSSLVALSLLTAGLVRYFPDFAPQTSGALGGSGVLFLVAHSFSRLRGSTGMSLVRYLSIRTLAINFAGLSILLTTLHLPLTLRENHWVTQEQFFPQKKDPFHSTPIAASFDQEFRIRLNTIIENSPIFQ